MFIISCYHKRPGSERVDGKANLRPQCAFLYRGASYKASHQCYDLNVNTLYFMMSAVSRNNFPTACYIITFFVKKQEIRFIDSPAGFSRSSGKCTAKSVLSLYGTLIHVSS